MTDKQKRFCEEYLIDLNATQAAIRAGYSENTARQVGCENLSKPNIQEKVRELMDSRSGRTQITADRVLQEVAALAFTNMTDLVRSTSGQSIKLEDVKDLPVNVQAAIKKIKTGQYGLEVELHNKDAALDKLMRHLGLYEKDNEQSKASVHLGLTNEELDDEIARIEAALARAEKGEISEGG